MSRQTYWRRSRRVKVTSKLHVCKCQQIINSRNRKIFDFLDLCIPHLFRYIWTCFSLWRYWCRLLNNTHDMMRVKRWRHVSKSSCDRQITTIWRTICWFIKILQFSVRETRKFCARVRCDKITSDHTLLTFEDERYMISDGIYWTITDFCSKRSCIETSLLS